MDNIVEQTEAYIVAIQSTDLGYLIKQLEEPLIVQKVEDYFIVTN